MQVAVIPNYQASGVCDALPQVCGALKKLGVSPLLPPRSAGFPSDETDGVIAASDVVIALGGDGTIIHTAKRAARLQRAVLGINCGTLGFMAGLEANELEQLSALIEGRYSVENRMMLTICLRDAEGDHCFSALNEAVVSRGALSRMMELDIRKREEPVVSYRADGVILATPTGSTAYSLSAGGPIVDPAVRCMLMTPICPHSLYARSYIFEEDTVLSVRTAAGPRAEALLTVDGEEGVAVSNEACIEVKRAETDARLIKIKRMSFYDVIGRKLMDRK